MLPEDFLERCLEKAVEVAKAAGKLQKERIWSDFSVAYKGEVDLVTEVDKACEEMIVSALKESFPDHGFLGEENVYQKVESPYTWVIDPLDGTTNFAHGFPWFCVSVALEVDGEPQVAVIYHVMMGELFTAIKGKGAYLNGSRMKVSPRQPLKQSLIATGFPYDRAWDAENNFDNFIKFQVGARAVRRAGAAALDLAYVAAGRLDGFWEAKLKPWDVAAGSLLVQEAGGRISNYAGEHYSIYDHRVVASNALIHEEMLELLHRPGRG